MRSLVFAIIALAACQNGALIVGTDQQNLRADDDGGGGDGTGSCQFSATGAATTTTYQSVLQGLWASLYQQFTAAHCPAPASATANCTETAAGNGNLSCTAFLGSYPVSAPPCTGDASCPGPDWHCVLPTGVCTRVCTNPCETAGACGTLLSCDVAYQCSECAQGICGSEHRCVPECDAQHPCGTGHCDAQTQRCVPDCIPGDVCGENKICNQLAKCVDRQCTLDGDCFDDPDHYRCVNGECLSRCDDANPCGVPGETCIDGVCTVTRCDANNPCPYGDVCTAGRCVHGCTTPGYECLPFLWCNPDTLQCEGCNCPAGQNCGPGGSCIDPCATVVCEYPQTCSDGRCVAPAEACGGLCDPFTQVCVNNQCISNGNCTSDWTCDLGEVCINNTCVPDGGGSGCVLDGRCDPDESCACDAFCCGGGGGGCGWGGGSTITYDQCAQCGGHIEFGGDGMYCVDMAMF